jgi:hypothetical protein
MQYAYAYQLNGTQTAGLDPDAKAYIAAVEAADGQALESSTKIAINLFVKGCKSDGIWNAIKSSCLLAGPRTLSGALVPLKGASPTNNNFISADYNRFTGLLGNGSTKYINSNRLNNADPRDNNHNSVYISNIVTPGTTCAYMGAGGSSGNGSNTISQSTNATFRCRSSVVTASTTHATGFTGISRNSSSQYDYRLRGTTAQHVISSTSPSSDNVLVFARSDGATVQIPAAARIAFYSIGESLSLQLLDSRINKYLTDLSSSLLVQPPTFILGSSTAGGANATAGNSWSNKFAAYDISTANTTNLAVGGSVISNAAPTGYTIPTGWTDTPDATKNITYAIAQGAKLVLINFASNFVNQTNGTTANYMNVLDAIVDECIDNNVDYRVFTTQPRSVDATKKQILKDTADAILSTYPTKSVDTYYGLYDSSTLSIKSAYDSGDGVHPNNAGHEYIYNQLVASLI